VSFWTWVVFLAAVCLLIARARRRRGRIGPASAGAIDDLLHQDRKKAIEIIVEERAAARDPETVDGLISNPESQVPTPKPRAEPHTPNRRNRGASLESGLPLDQSAMARRWKSGLGDWDGLGFGIRGLGFDCYL
jgi:hypothetical protein